MNKPLLLRLLACMFGFSFFLYSYLNKQNELTQLRIQLPLFAKEIKAAEEENTRLKYEIDQFENPEHLIELARRNEFSHLKYPLAKEIVTLQEGLALSLPEQEKEERLVSFKPQVILGAGHHY